MLSIQAKVFCDGYTLSIEGSYEWVFDFNYDHDACEQFVIVPPELEEATLAMKELGWSRFDRFDLCPQCEFRKRKAMKTIAEKRG